MTKDCIGQLSLFDLPNLTCEPPEPPRNKKDNETMTDFTEKDRAVIVPQLTRIINLLNRPMPYSPVDAGEWKQIIAQLLEQLAPFIVQLLISFLMKPNETLK